MRRAALLLLAAAALAGPAHARVSLPRPDAAAVRGGGAPHVYYEVRTPAGRPRGVVLMLHGGGWCGANEPETRECGLAEERIREDQFDGGYSDPWGGRVFTRAQHTTTAAGYVTVGASYASDEAGLADVLALHDQAAQRWPGLPIFAWGQSAGGQWALMLGALRPLAGVVGEAAPADFASWAKGEQGAFFVDEYLPGIFGGPDDEPPNIDNYDPSRFYPQAEPPVLLLTAAGSDDPTVPAAVARAFARQVPGARVASIPAGDHWWVHSQVDLAALARARADAIAFLDGLAR